MRLTSRQLSQSGDADLQAIGRQLTGATQAYQQVVDYIVEQSKADPRAVHAGSVPYLKLAGIVHGGWQLGRAALAAAASIEAARDDAEFMRAKIGTARYFADHMLTQAGGLRDSIVDGNAGVLALTEAQF